MRGYMDAGYEQPRGGEQVTRPRRLLIYVI